MGKGAQEVWVLLWLLTEHGSESIFYSLGWMLSVSTLVPSRRLAHSSYKLSSLHGETFRGTRRLGPAA